jgi:putative transposase
MCVKRFGRFPHTLIVDGGKEFASVYFETLVARYSGLKKTRPGAKPRFGSVIERLFGTTNTELVYTLLGNTQAAKRVRQMTKDIDPKRQAVWTLGDLYAFLCEWAYEVYDQMEHPALGQSPRDAFLQGLSRTGEREHRWIPYDEEFLMESSPTTRKGKAKVEPGRGIKIHGIYYSAPALRQPDVEGTSVNVRYDPFDIGTAYAYVRRRWVRCVSQYHAQLSGHSEKELLVNWVKLRPILRSHAGNQRETWESTRVRTENPLPI